MNTQKNIWEQLDAELRPRLIAVGFRQADFPPTPRPQIDGVIYNAFEASYGLLFCVQLPDADPKQIATATNFACDTMREELAKSASNDWSRDGYVLAAMAGPPNSAEAKQALRNFEQSRSICRRHAIWPEALAPSKSVFMWAARLDRVTVLALPESEASSTLSTPPLPGPKFIETIYSGLNRNESYKAIAEQIVRAAREQENFHAA